MPAKTTVALIREARAILDLHIDGALASFLGVSRRTVQRHVKTGGIPIGSGHGRLIRALHPRNPDLALTLAQALNIDLSDIVPPDAPKVAAGQVNEIVLAACDALNMTPRAVRPALVTIFRHASALGVDLDQLAELLAAGDGVTHKNS